MPVGKRTVTADDFFPTKEWRILSLASGMLPDPYTGIDGVEEVSEGVFRVTTRAATKLGQLDVAVTLRLAEPMEEMRMVFSPLLDRFYAGQDYRMRAVKVSDSGRIRNELQTLCSEAKDSAAAHASTRMVRIFFMMPTSSEKPSAILKITIPMAWK